VETGGRRMTRKTRNILLGIIILVAACYLFKIVADAQYKGMMDVKTVREAKVVAMRKEFVKFDETNHFYINDRGEPVE
jgi:hypothetical protein